jgi:hypothetical protein
MRMLFGFAVVSMLMTPALSAQPQTKLPAKMIGTWCVGEDAASGGASTVYHRSKNSEGIGCSEVLWVRQNGYDGNERGCTIKKIERLVSSAYLIRAVCEGERSTWTEVSKFQISDGQLVIADVHSTRPQANRTRRRLP